MKVHLGIDIGGSKAKLGLVDEEGKVLERSRLQTGSQHSFDAVFDKIMASVSELLQRAEDRGMEVGSMGFGIPGTTDSEAGSVVFAPNLNWRDIDFLSSVSNRFDLEIHIEQDTRAAAFAEFLFGATDGSKNIVCITLGTGIGCGIIIDGKIYKGAKNTAGEFGHTIVRPHGELCNCGRRGCLEAYTSGPAIVRLAKQAIPDYRDYLTGADLTARDVFALAAKDIAGAKKVTTEVVELLSVAVVNLINVLSPERIILSGGISNAENRLLLDPIRDYVRSNAYCLLAKEVEVTKSILGEDAPLIGAAMLYRSKSIQASIEW